MKTACCIGLVLSLLAAGFARGAPDRWEKIGPSGGVVFCAAVHPTSLDTIYATLEEGVYKSVDGGENWSKLSRLPAPGHIVVFDPQDPNIIYAWAGYRLYKSLDGGDTWTQITSFYGRSFAVDPSHPNRLYVGSYNGVYTHEASIYISVDAGVSWVESKIGGCCLASAIAVDPGDSNVIYTGMEGDWDFPGSGVQKSTDGGLTWEDMSSGLPYSNISCLEMDPSDPLTLYAGTAGGGQYSADGIYKTTDGGVTWTGINNGLPVRGFVRAIRIDPNDPEVLYASVSGGLFKSTDGGANWFYVDTGMSHGDIYSVGIFPGDTDILLLGSELGVLKSTSGGGEFVQMGIIPLGVSSVVVDHADSKTIYAIGKGVFKSTDFGESWEPINKGLGGGGVIVQDPKCSEVLYAGFYAPWGAVFKTTNAGETWQKTSLGDVAINDIGIAPTNHNVVFAGGLEDPFIGGIFRSEDAGSTWETVLNFYTNCIAIDPKDASVVYAGGHTGLRKSTDGGTTWFPIEDGLNLPESGYVLSFAIDPRNTNVLYCGTNNAGVFKSVDGGAHWENASTGIPPNMTGRKDIRALAVDPEDPVIYAGVYGGGVYVSANAGETWNRLGAGSGSSSSFSLALDPNDPNIVYSAGGGLWRYIRTTSCMEPEIESFSPAVVNSDNCPDGCTVSFVVEAEGDCSEIAMVALERRSGDGWVVEDAILPPVPDPNWTLKCTFDEHFTDGEHEFRAVIRCKDGSRAATRPVVVTAERGVPVTITGFEGDYSQGRVTLRWTIAGAASIRGFNLYRSFKQDSGFRRINATPLAADAGYEYIDEDVQPGRTYWYRLRAVGTEGEWFSQTTSVAIPPSSLVLFQNRPNPFNPSTVISFTLPGMTRTRLSIYNVEGKLVTVLADGMLDEGYKEFTWNATDAGGNPVSSGVYFCRLKAGNKVLTKKMVLLR